MKIKILSYNIHKGFDWKNRNYCLSEIKQMINSSKAEIVFLQEVVGKNDNLKEKGLIDTQFEYLADELWPHYSYAKNALYDHGHHGNLIISKYPIESFENINLSTNNWEQRGMLVCRILIPELQRYIYAACLHLNLLHSGRVAQYEIIKEYVESQGHPIDTPYIIAGDFNDWNQKSCLVFEDKLQMTEAYKAKHGKFAKTFPAQIPFLCLDRIYVKNLHIHSADLLNQNLSHLSDHLPIVSEVELYEG